MACKGWAPYDGGLPDLGYAEHGARRPGSGFGVRGCLAGPIPAPEISRGLGITPDEGAQLEGLEIAAACVRPHGEGGGGSIILEYDAAAGGPTGVQSWGVSTDEDARPPATWASACHHPGPGVSHHLRRPPPEGYVVTSGALRQQAPETPAHTLGGGLAFLHPARRVVWHPARL